MQDQNSTSPVPPPPKKTLPPNGTKVVAMTYPSIEYEREAKEVTGILHSVETPLTKGLDTLPQCWVEGVQVDPDTVRPAANPIEEQL